MPILFQSRNIRHFLGMYSTKQIEQEISVIAQECNDVFFGNGLEKTAGVRSREKKEETVR